MSDSPTGSPTSYTSTTHSAFPAQNSCNVANVRPGAKVGAKQGVEEGEDDRALGVGVGVGVAVAVGVAAGLGVRVGGGVRVGVRVWVGAGVAVSQGDGVSVGMGETGDGRDAIDCEITTAIVPRTTMLISARAAKTSHCFLGMGALSPDSLLDSFYHEHRE